MNIKNLIDKNIKNLIGKNKQEVECPNAKMTFGTALVFLKKGGLLRRNGWKKDCYILLNDKTFIVVDLEYDERKHWNPEDYHLVAEDWEFYTPKLDASRIIGGVLDASKISTGTLNASNFINVSNIPNMTVSVSALDTIQTKQKLNDVYVYDKEGPGGANHAYKICKHGDTESAPLAIIQFQNGARLEEGSRPGVIDSDLLEMIKHRLEAFQAGPFASDYNATALHHITLALEALNQRVEDRIARDVLGKEQK